MFQPSACICCHDVSMKSMNLKNMAVLNIQNVNHRCLINRISKGEAVNLLEKC